MKWRAKPALTRQAWLEKLARRLVWTFPANQVKDILSDYQEQFDAGHDHGKTEAEIIQALGSPEEAAALLLEEDPSARIDGLRQTVLWGAALAVCSFGLWLGLVRSIHEYSLLLFLFLPLTVSALFLLLRGPARVLLGQAAASENRISSAAVYCIPAGIMLAVTALQEILILSFLRLNVRLPENIGPMNVFALALIALAMGLLAAWLLFRSLTRSIRYFPGIVHACGAAFSLLAMSTVYTSMKVDIFPELGILFSLVPYLTGLVTALVFQRWVDRRRPLPRFFWNGEVTWQDWRHRLGVGLLGWYDAPQAIEVLEDYQEQVELAREQGKTEEAVLSELGRPEAVVRDLLKEDRKARLRRRKTWVWAVLAGLSGWLLLGLLRCFEFGYTGFGQFYSQNVLQISLFTLVLGTVSLFFLLHARERTAVERRFPAPKKPAVWLILPPLAASALVESLVLYLICNTLDYRIPVFLGKPMTWYITLAIEFSTLFLVLLLIWTLDRCVSGSIRRLPALPLIAGSMAHVLCAGIYLKSMDMESLYFHEIAGTVRANLTAVFPLLAGLALAAALWLVLRAAGKKEG